METVQTGLTTQTSKGKGRHNFKNLSPEKHREIAAKGGRSAHEKGTAWEWTGGPDGTAADAGRKGGTIAQQRRREQAETSAKS